ncbi:MAG: peptidase M23 [Rhodobacteraceae bacterium]|nr:peptidase M23 [Paracoccaceae bacterium]
MALAATPALAHPGAHLHPHGVDQAWIFAVATLFAAAVGALIARGRK